MAYEILGFVKNGTRASVDVKHVTNHEIKCIFFNPLESWNASSQNKYVASTGTLLHAS